MKTETRRFGNLASFRLNILSRITERLAENQYRQAFGLTLLQARVLGVVGESSALRFADVITKLELEKGQASRLIAGLIERGLLEKPPGKRAAIVRLTPEGRGMWDAIYDAALDRNRRLVAGLSAKDVAVFNKCLSLMTATAQSMSASPHPERSTAQRAAGAAPVADPPISLVLDRQVVAELHMMLGAALGMTGTEPTP